MEEVVRPLKILLVDDNADDTLITRRLLRSAGAAAYTIKAVNSYDKAADALGGDFDVCLLDYELDGHTALDLLARFDFETLPGPVIILTNHDGQELDQTALQLGVADFLGKGELGAELLNRTIRYSHHQFQDQCKLRYLAQHDSLTGLLNRRMFVERLKHWLEVDGYPPELIVLFYLDLDGFKNINDAWGHDVGDLALRHTADCLSSALRQSDLVARYGGDELVAAVKYVDPDSIDALGHKIMHAVRQPMTVDNRQMTVTCSIGAALASQSNDGVEGLIRLADHAMLSAKQSGRDTLRRYSGDIRLRSADSARLQAELRTALDQGALHMVYEPQIDLHSLAMTGAEALVRWNRPQSGPISPAEFVPLAEESGLIRPLAEFTLDVAIAALAQLQGDGLPAGFSLAINLSTYNLLDTMLPAQLESLLHKHGVAAHSIRLELTETALLHEQEHALKQLQALHALGVSLALDDFGTGFSSLSMLTTLPIDTLKIDVGFIARILEDPLTSALVRALLRLGNDLGMNVIAEGIETQPQLDWLRDNGCHLGQGYLIGTEESVEQLDMRLRGVPV